MEELKADFSNLKAKIEELIHLLEINLVTAECYSVERTIRGEANPARIGVSKLDRYQSKYQGLNNYRIQQLDGFFTVPKRIVGVIVPHLAIEGDVRKRVGEINEVKDHIKNEMVRLFSCRKERSRKYKELAPLVMPATIYRHINVAPQFTYRSNFSWSDKQVAPNEITKDQAKEIVKAQRVEVGNGFSVEDRIERDLASVNSLGSDVEILRLAEVKAHPVQSLTSRPPWVTNGPSRIHIKATSPVIVFREHQKGIITKPLVAYNREAFTGDSKRSVPSTFKPIVAHLGIYARN
ncbi:DNA replication terminus site-binding protein [Photobacterium lutimaris]|nr:DNA replication terminus site-binding protein [Photobacterium lutimaris]TDR72710.1 DNA replication terminus site binding protein [Photobacterium lutimaris]